MISCYISSFPDDADIVFNRLKRAIHMTRYPSSATPTCIFEKLTEDYEEDICALKQFTNCPDPLSSLWLAGNLGAVP